MTLLLKSCSSYVFFLHTLSGPRPRNEVDIFQTSIPTFCSHLLLPSKFLSFFEKVIPDSLILSPIPRLSSLVISKFHIEVNALISQILTSFIPWPCFPFYNSYSISSHTLDLTFPITANSPSQFNTLSSLPLLSFQLTLFWHPSPTIFGHHQNF